ncbi:hypothetical protein NKH56_15050 [Mesorhizobium sp. M1076]|uniref:hypothetical protein n=1 Tax=Mesorhizobium sp. M1076 TaxID=2957054 RepID=UPI003335D09A
MVEAIKEKREPRASIRRALHIVEIGEALSISSQTRRFVQLTGVYERSAPFGYKAG